MKSPLQPELAKLFKTPYPDRIFLKNVKVFPSLSEGTLAFSATTYFDNEPFLASNAGRGGCNSYNIAPKGKPQTIRSAEQWAEALAIGHTSEKLDWIITEHILMSDRLKQLKRDVKKKICFMLPSDDIQKEHRYIALRNDNPEYRKNQRKLLLAKYPGAIILDDLLK
jgi:hypothetical protein